MRYGKETHQEESIHVAKQYVNLEVFHLQQWKAHHSPHLTFYSSLACMVRHYGTKQLQS